LRGGRERREAEAPRSSSLLRRARSRTLERGRGCLGDSVEWCEFAGVLGGPFYMPEKGGERGVQHGLGLGFSSAFPWSQWFWKGMGMSAGVVVT
jgi:hypothetical protein